MELLLDRPSGRLSRLDGLTFNLKDRVWTPAPAQPDGDLVSIRNAVRWMQRETKYPNRVPVGVIGPREASRVERREAEKLGELLAEMGLTVLCGGRQGVMEAVCLGVKRKGGLSIGLLPDEQPSAANPYVSVPIATGIGISRNVIIARASLCIVAVGGGYGTISEAACGLQFGKQVLGIGNAPALPGVHRCKDAASAAVRTAEIVLALE